MRGDKWTKIPHDAQTGQMAESDEPLTWSTFAQAGSTYDRGGWDGIGFMFAATDPYCGIDLDHSITSGGHLKPWAQELADDLNSYSEISPSGTGIKIWVRARLPDTGHRRPFEDGAVELYDQTRFFTVTGNRFGSAETINEAQNAVLRTLLKIGCGPKEKKPTSAPRPMVFDATDNEIIERAGNAKNGLKFRALIQGNNGGYHSQSEADLGLCNYLIFWTRGDRERTEAIFNSTPFGQNEKWKSREDYRRRTIDKALEGRGPDDFYRPPSRIVRTTQASVVSAASEPPNTEPLDAEPLPPQRPDHFSNFFVEEREGDDGKTSTVKVGYSAQQIRTFLTALADDWPRRVGKLPFARIGDSEILWLESPDELFAWIGQQLPDGEVNRLEWSAGGNAVSQSRFYCHLQQTATEHTSVERFPHFPQLKDHFYAHPQPTTGDGSAFSALLAQFCPATEDDGLLLKAFFLSLFWGGTPGSRPSWLITGEEGNDGRGIGKSHVHMAAARLTDGAITISPSDAMKDVKVRLFSAEGRGRRLLVLDNVKTLRFSWDELEAFVTADIISGHAMYLGECRVPNVLTVVITLNGANLSKDMAQRVIPIRLKRPTYAADWWEKLARYIDENRWAIIGDIAAVFEREPSKLEKVSRWGSWESAVLARLPRPEKLQETIETHQSGIDADAEEMNLIREAIMDEIRRLGYDPDTSYILITSKVMANIFERATGDKKAPNKVSAYIGTLGIPELRKSMDTAKRGWRWIGASTACGGTPIELIDVRQQSSIPP